MSYHTFLQSLFGSQYTLHRSYLHGIHLDCVLIYDGPLDIHQHIRERTTYALSVQHRPTKKLLRNVYPIMLGSQIDLAIRHQQVGTFEANIPTVSNASFQEVDIGRGFFIICGFFATFTLFFLPMIRLTRTWYRKMVRVFTYDALDRGKRIELLRDGLSTQKTGRHDCGGKRWFESIEQVDCFFDHCPYRTDAAAYMAQVYQQNRFDIDSLVNKIVVSPGHLFTKLFVKYLYAPLRKGNWSLIKSKKRLWWSNPSKQDAYCTSCPEKQFTLKKVNRPVK
ncbi:RNA_pol_Rpb2_6 domain-containing protein [Trichonephila clavipes]|nr:RNA_pol_Rpb2_6 domain-containing protein [Trichonephila clavipes]